MPESRSCATCAYSVARERQVKNTAAMRAIDLSEPQLYECRRNPPQMILMGITPTGAVNVGSQFPLMGAEHWCGEHSRREGV